MQLVNTKQSNDEGAHLRRFVVTLVGSLCTFSATAADLKTKPQLSRPGWYAGMPVMMDVRLPERAGGTAPNAPSDAYPDLVVYVTAPTSSGQPASPEMSVPTAAGMKVLPAHEDVVTRMVAAREPADSTGYFVVVGPKSDDSNTRWQPDPPNSWPAAPLAREIFVGTDWVKLNNHVVIEYGLAMGWLALKYFDYGGLGSTRYMDSKANFDVQITVEPATSLPSRK